MAESNYIVIQAHMISSHFDLVQSRIKCAVRNFYNNI